MIWRDSELLKPGCFVYFSLVFIMDSDKGIAMVFIFFYLLVRVKVDLALKRRLVDFS